ncbi:VanZ family protein [Rubellimicrobium arenae]|uniref:VanZ family protein n=1 Tax=Rubellimicrobium arenae TaxID=2817372 RepID=UPI001B30B275|nr:VanZ family protein [Rubellimicrobium arenae]
MSAGFAHLLSYAGGAAAYAVAGTAALVGLGVAAGWRPLAQAWQILLVTLLFVSLTQHPFPDRSALACPVGAAAPNLHPFSFLGYLIHGWRRAPDLGAWLAQGQLLSVAMNFVLCAVIGALLPRHRIGFGTALLLGCGLSLAVELTQLTGIWGLYPCAYRKFDVDDLILNILGVAAGYFAGRGVRRA